MTHPMISEEEETLKRIRTYNVLGKKCWSTSGTAIAIGKHRNTVQNWVRMTLVGELNLPILREPYGKNKNHVMIPVDEFIAWYNYESQN